MFSFLKRKLKNQKGAIDKVIVTLLLIMMGVGAAAGLKNWADEKIETTKTNAGNKIDSVVNESTTTTTTTPPQQD
ncbi:hypothetical protein CRU99_07065 [Malaciobacter mytili]|uniref:hypothetical protein n=1 Tax=Malaciobacter mytili TaxID=603050 RepID=UPI00100B3FB7|nr:hypothetical protein [Malaciobacter mytili]RXI43584.1 hypothetical protein CRU99_07065 [Malaciobacter mytili]